MTKPRRTRKKTPQTPEERLAAFNKAATRALGERKGVQAPCVSLGRLRGWEVLEIAVSATRKYNAEGKQVKNPILMTPGIPDSYWCKNGKHFWVEFKRPGEKPTKTQTAMHMRLRAHGEIVWVVEGVEQMQEILRRYDGPPRHEKLTGLKQVTQ